MKGSVVEKELDTIPEIEWCRIKARDEVTNKRSIRITPSGYGSYTITKPVCRTVVAQAPGP